MVIVSSAKISNKHQEHLQQQFPNITWHFCESINEAQAYSDMMEVLITYGEDIQDNIVVECPNLKWIQVISAGVEKMPLQTLAKHGVIVTNARGIHKTPMAEYTLGIMLQHVRRFPTFLSQQQQRIWDRNPRIDELAGKTLGILGAGAIGSEIARKAKAFDMYVIGMNQSGRSESFFDAMYTSDQLEHILSKSDFFVVILPLTPATSNMIGEKELRSMKSTAVLINIARGAIIEENALVTALQQNWIEAAYLDVFVEEPLPTDHALWTLPNCFITPHISGRSPHYMKRALEIFTYNLTHYVKGDVHVLRNRIDAKKGY